MNIIKIGDRVIVVLKNGTTLERSGLTQDELNTLFNADDSKEDDVINIMIPNYAPYLKEREEKLNYLKYIEDGNTPLVVKGDSVYWPEVSELSLPEQFVQAIVKAYQSGIEDAQIAYKNFWTLCSLNPDERCRRNLFWFLEKHDLKISKCGFFVAYRNADTTEEEGVYTDHHSHSTRIKIGDMVTMPREECDSIQDHECSVGLHVASSNWLSRNYYGNQGLVVLVNPMDVCAVPNRSNYGKMRTCAYLPIAKAEFDDNGRVIPINLKTGFECSYVTKVIYEGLLGKETDSPYRITIPKRPEINKETVTDALLDIAMKAITEKQI